MKPHHTDKHTPIVCPNCGFHADHNYCAQCGQETHLHKETFGGLIMHFVGHYFHYDSKFWMTLKALWFSPGKLTKAYIANQRMRYIPPISLYIFLSAVFFLVMFSFPKEDILKTVIHNSRQAVDSLDKSIPIDTGNIKLTVTKSAKKDTSFLDKRFYVLEKEHEKDLGKYLTERFWHHFPKIFFLMIPAVALILKLRFLRRKALYFVHHAIYSLHLHSFFFSIMLIRYLNPFDAIDLQICIAILIAGAIYLVVSLKRVYEIKYFRAILTAIFMAIGYSFIFGFATLLILFAAVFLG